MTVGFFHVGPAGSVHVRLAERLVASVRRVMPNVPIVQMTDSETPAIAGVFHVERREPRPIAIGTLEHFAACDGDWLLVDTDVIVQADVRHIFRHPFDIAVATREGTLRRREVGKKFMDRMPFNKGAVFSRSPAFWAAAADLRLQSEKAQAWMGDQQSMNTIIRSGAFKVITLPSGYNYPPLTAREDVSRHQILHYKGDRKPWMLERAS